MSVLLDHIGCNATYSPQANKLNNNPVPPEYLHLNAHYRFTLFKTEIIMSPTKPISSPILMLIINPSQKLFILIIESPLFFETI